MLRTVIKPTLTLKEAEQRYEGCFLTRADYDVLVEETSLGVLTSGEPKFLFLRNVIPPRTCAEIYSILRESQYKPVASSHRAALKGSRAGEHMLMGFFRDKITKRPRYSKSTGHHVLRGYLYTILPLLTAMSGLVRETPARLLEPTSEGSPPERSPRHCVGIF